MMPFNPTLDNAIGHDIASAGQAVSEVIDTPIQSTDAQDVSKLILISSLANVPNALLGLSPLRNCVVSLRSQARRFEIAHGLWWKKGPSHCRRQVWIRNSSQDNDDTGEATLRLVPRNGDTVHYEIGAPATTASSIASDPRTFKTRDLELSFLCVDSKGKHETGEPVPWTNTITLKHRFYQNGGDRMMELQGAPSNATVRYTNGNPKLRKENKPFRENLQKLVFSRMSYDEKLDYCDRPEHIEGPSTEAWKVINAHLGTHATSLSELVRELGEREFGHTPRVGDAFCGGGSIPFEAARIGCDAYGSDLNPPQIQLPKLPEVALTISSDVPIGGFQATIKYDRRIVRMDKAAVRGGSGEGFDRVPVTVAVNADAGTVTINSFQIGKAPQGSFSVATLPFGAVSRGTTALQVTNLILVDTQGNEILATGRLALSAATLLVP